MIKNMPFLTTAKAQKIEKLLDENTPLKLSVIKDIVTAENLCLCPDPIKAAFEVSRKFYFPPYL